MAQTNSRGGTEPLDLYTRRAKIYFWVVLVCACLSLLLSVWYFPNFIQVNHFDLFLFLSLNILAEQSFVVLKDGSKVSASFAIMLSVLLLFNPPIAVGIVMAGALVSVGLIQRRSWRIAWFNAAQYALTYSVAAWAMHLMDQQIGSYFSDNLLFRFLLTGGVATATYLLLNLPLVNTYVALRQYPEISLRHLVRRLLLLQEDRVEIFQTLFFYPIAVLVAYSYQREHNPIIPILLGLLVFGGLRFVEQRRRIERQREKMEVLYHLTRRMGESVLVDTDLEVPTGLVFDHLFNSDASSFKRLIYHDRTSVYRVEGKGDDQRIVHEKTDSLREPDKVYRMDAPGVLQEVVRTKRPLRLSDLSWLDGAYTPWRIAYQALMAWPLMVDDEVAFILVMFRSTGEAFQLRDEELVRLLVNSFEITLKNIQLRNHIQEQAIKDGLMGVFNHRYLKSKLEDEMARSKRYDKPLSLIIADVDYFKQFNDTHGHLLGDKVLKEVAGILLQSVRETDIVARYGGEELAILLPETPLEGACDVAERIRRNVAEFAFTGKDQQRVKLTLSLGVSHLDQEPELTSSELIIRTDTALYRAKHQGRNQICKASMEQGRLVIETYSKGTQAAPPLLNTPALEPEPRDFLEHCLQALLDPESATVPFQEALRTFFERIGLAEQLFLALPVFANQYRLQSVWPESAAASAEILLQDELLMWPKEGTPLLQVSDQELPQFITDLPLISPQWLLLPLWYHNQWQGLLGIALGKDVALSVGIQSLLKRRAQHMAETLWILNALQTSQAKAFQTLQALVMTLQSLEGSVKAERMQSLAQRLAQRLNWPLSTQNMLNQGVYLLCLSEWFCQGQEGHHRRQRHRFLQRFCTTFDVGPLMPVALSWGERWDGSGFPQGLKAQQIPFESRLLSLVAAFVAVCPVQVNGLEALEELIASGYYDPKLCQLLKDVICESNR